MSSQHSSRRVALITGAAGEIGQRLCDHLATEDKNIIGLYRNKLPKAHKNTLPLCCDLKSAEAIVPPLKSTDTVIHLAWQGGVLGSCARDGQDVTDERVRASENVILTANVVKAMEKANTKRIVFLSWVGVDRHADNIMLREKYWAENIIINSSIPEKVIIRAGVVGTGQVDNDFYKSAGILAKMPLILPLPRKIEGVVLTTLKDVFAAIDNILKSNNEKSSGCRIIDITSTSPTSGAKVLEAMDTKAWGHRRLAIGGIIGDALFRLTERKFGAGRTAEARMTDFFEASTPPTKIPAQGLPPTVLTSPAGHKIELVDAL